MYCSHCGAQAGGNFCSRCGQRLTAPAAAEPPEVLESDAWIDEILYENLIRYRHVREQIALAGGRVRKSMTGEELLALVDAVAPTGISLEKLSAVLVPFYDRLGFRTGTEESLRISAAPGRALLAMLCALIARGMEPSGVRQMADGCQLTAKIPSTIWSNPGEIVVTVQVAGSLIQFHAVTKIMGQLFDWGKSKRLLAELFAEVRRELQPYQGEPPLWAEVA